ncbi:MAG: hypothetical protein Kow0081_3890 [Candidatus Dojkabacteria bacterium]
MEKSEDSEGSTKLSIKNLALLRIKLTEWYRKNLVYRLFWGRSNLYKNIVHFIVITSTLIFTVTGFSSRFLAQASTQTFFVNNEPTQGTIDLLEQGGNVESILPNPTGSTFQIIDYVVQTGDTFDSISSKFNVTPERIKLSNLDVISYYDDKPKPGITLKIPEINGILIKLNGNDSLDSIIGNLTQGNRLDIIEINNLKAPDYSLEGLDYIFVPDGLINPPPPPTPQIRYVAPPAPAPVPSVSEAVFAGIQFVDPLSNPSCVGYGYSRGFSSWHNGVDLPKRGGCHIRAAAAGTVEFAGWSSGGEGFMVRINHGNGVKTLYFHGNGDFYVTPGQYVSAGQDIMYMGCTGYCTGTHLHFSIKYNGAWVDPAPYVPYWRP